MSLAIDDLQIARPRTKTQPIPETHRIVVDLADGDAAAAFLELAAMVIRKRQRIVITIEAGL